MVIPTKNLNPEKYLKSSQISENETDLIFMNMKKAPSIVVKEDQAVERNGKITVGAILKQDGPHGEI
jgi:hypothetical protein